MKTILRFAISCLLVLSCTLTTLVFAQYPPAAGQMGSTAIHKDSSVFIAWASECQVVRGLKNIAEPDSGYVTVGDSSMATGAAGTNGVVSLGDGGVAVLQFQYPIVNGNSWDFAVFENSFDDFFLELAFVEVSSDGVNYARFPAHSLTDTLQQVGAFDSLDATKINNLAGKYRGMYGVPFDLEELKNEPGLDVDHITHVRIVDVVGSLLTQYATYDTAGRKVNDPWPTPFASGGFDLDAVGVIWNTTNAMAETGRQEQLRLYPNPCTEYVIIDRSANERQDVIITLRNLSGVKLYDITTPMNDKTYRLDVSDFAAGLYFITVASKTEILTGKLFIR